MKELFLFIKNNRIIYKISIVSILILMLISVMQINPKNVEKNSVSGDLVEKDYAIMFGEIEGNAVFLDSINGGSIDDATLTSLGISYGDLDENGYHKIVLSGTNFKSTSNMGLIIDGVDVNIVLTDGTTNKISSSYNANADEFYGIVNRGGTIKITGEGTLETSCYNLEKINESDEIYKTTCAISASSSEDGSNKGKVIIESGTVIAKANGAYGTAIYGEKSVDILRGTVKAYGGDKGSTSGISAQEKINIANATVDVKVSSEDLCVSGIHTEYDGHGDSITISNNAEVNIDVATTKCNEDGSGISSGRLHITESIVNVKMNGKAIVGLKTVYTIGEEYPEVPAEYKREMIIDRSKVTIKGNKCYDSAAIAAYDSNATISGSEIDVNVKNSEKVATKNGLYGINVWRENSVEGGDISIDNSNIDIKVYNNEAAAIQAFNDITTSNSNIEASVDGEEQNPWMVGINVGGKLTVNSGRVVAKGKNEAINIKDMTVDNIDSKLVLDTNNSVNVIVASTDYNIADVDKYSTSSWWDYKYMEIGTIHDYYLKFVAENKTMYKVTTEQETTTNSEGKTVVNMVDVASTPIESDGWSIGIVNDDMIKKGEYNELYKGLPILELDNMQFVTNQLYGLYIEGDCVINVKDGTRNLIEATGVNDSPYTYSIYSDNNIKFVGNGDIDLYSVKAKKIDAGNTSYGISVNDIEINNTTINITVRGYDTYGIYVNSMECNIRGGNITLDMQASHYAYGLYSNSNMSIFNDAILDIDIYGSHGSGICAKQGRVLVSGIPNIKIDIECDEKIASFGEGGIGILSLSDIEVQGGEIEIKINNGILCYAISSGSNFSIEKGKIKIYSSIKDIPTDFNEDIFNFSKTQRKILNAFCNIDILGGNIEINDQTSNNISGIFCGGTYSETGGIVRVNLAGENTIGVETASAPVQVNTAGTLEVTASKVMNVAPTLSDSGVTISEAKLISDPTTSKYTGTSASEVPEYCYARIQPNYYLTYNSSEMYKNNTSTPVTVPNWSAKEDGTLVLDGFNFTTSHNFGLDIVGDTVIELAEGSTNSIVSNYKGTTQDSSTIRSYYNLTIKGNGALNISCNNNYDMTKATIGLFVDKKLKVEDSTINIITSGRKTQGLSALGSLDIKNATFDIDVHGVEWAEGIVIAGKNKDNIVKNSKITMDVVSDTKEVYGIETDATESVNAGIKFENSVFNYNVEVNENGDICYGIYATGKVSVVDSEINGSIKSKDVIKNGSDYVKQQMGIYAGAKSGIPDSIALAVDNSLINMKVNCLVGYGLYAEYGGIEICNNSYFICNMLTEATDLSGTWAYAIYNDGQVKKPINIDSSSIQISGENIREIKGISTNKASINISNTYITGKTKTSVDSFYGIYMDAKPIEENLSICICNSGVYYTSNGKYAEGVYCERGTIGISDSRLNFALSVLDGCGIGSAGKLTTNNSYLDITIGTCKNSSESYAVGVYSSLDDVELNNTECIINIVSSVEDKFVLGISSMDGNVTINGGSTTITVEGGRGAGILSGFFFVVMPSLYSSEDINVIINNNANVTVTAKGISSSGEMNGIQATKGNRISISDSTVTSTVESVGNCSVIVIDKDTSSNINIASSNITLENKSTSTTKEVYGIKSSGSVTIENCPGVKILSTVGYNSYLVYANQEINITNVDLLDMDINYGGKFEHGYGLFTVNNNITVAKSTVNIDATRTYELTTSNGYMDGILTQNGQNISVKDNSNIHVYADTQFIRGIMAYSKETATPFEASVKISELSNVDIKGTSGYGIYSGGDDSVGDLIDINNSNIIINIGTSMDKGSYPDGIYCSGKVNIINNSIIKMVIYGAGQPGGIVALKDDISISHSTIDIKVSGGGGQSIVSRSGNIILNNSNITVINDEKPSDIKEIYSYGLYVADGKTISITGGTVVAKGYNKAIGVSAVDKLILDKGGDMSTELIEGSTVYDYTSSDIIEYPSVKSLASYKYIKIGEVPTYYYRYTNNKLYKVQKDSPAIELDSNTWPEGCSIADNKLQLNGFNFVTTANKVIDIVGEANVLVSGINTIRNVCNTVDYNYGIYSDSTINITSTGGTLNAKYVNHNYLNESGKHYIALHSEGDISIDGGSYIVNAQEDNTIGVDGQNITIQNASVNVKGQVNYSGMGIHMSNYSNTVKNINIIDTAVEVNIKSLYKGDNYVCAIFGENYDLENWNTVGEINMTGGRLVANIEGYVADGIYGDYNNISIDGTTMVINSSVMDGINTLSGGEQSANGIVNDGTLELKNVNINIIADNKDTYTGSALYSDQNMSIISSDIIVQINGDNSLGIVSSANLTIKNSTVDAKGGKSAIAVGSTGSCNVNGRVDASTTVDGELAYIKDSVFNNHYTEYKHVNIVPKVISVNITWGDMDFKYSESDWNASSHDYNTKIWSNKTTDGDKITVANAGSNVPVTASIAYNKDSNYTGITGTILQSKEPATEYTNNTTVDIESNIDAYLALDGRLSSSTTPRTIIGNVTLTISE